MAAAATLRARERSDNAALVAVGRLRAPQSVFNPLHRTPSRPEMRRSITHGRFSPVGRKLWRQSEGLSPRTGQLCLSPRRRTLVGEGNGVGVGAAPSSGDKPVDVADWYEGRPSSSTRQQESQWGLADVAVNTSGVSADSNDRFQGGGEGLGDVPPKSGRFGGGERRAEIDAGRDEGPKTAGEGACGLNRIDEGNHFVPRGRGGVRGEGGAMVAAAAAAAVTATEAQGDYGAMPTTSQGRHDEGVAHRLDTGDSDEFVGTAKSGDGDAHAGWAEGAPNRPERPPYSTATRCVSYTVKLPWDGHK